MRAALGLVLGLTTGLHYIHVQQILPALQGLLQSQLLSYLIPPATLALAALSLPFLPPILTLTPLLIFSLIHTSNLPRLELPLLCLLTFMATIPIRPAFLTALPSFLIALLLSHYLPQIHILQPLAAPLMVASAIALHATSLSARRVSRPTTKGRRRRRRAPRPSVASAASSAGAASSGPITRKAAFAYIIVYLGIAIISNFALAPIGKAVVRSVNPRRLPAGYTILAQERSVTGLVTVLQLSGRYRMLTADASVLGGLHIKKGYDQDSIFGQFYVHEAVRLTRRPGEADSEQGGREGRTLCIGLGIGVVAQGLHTLGCEVDVVEIDPVIVEYARRYFGMEVPNVYAEDALVFLERRREARVYDYVIHDVFTGGCVPLDMFSVQTMRGIEGTMKGDGVLAVNFVGMLDDAGAPGTRSVAVVYDRLLSVFGNVVAFSDGDDSRLHNVVLFASKVKERVLFRKAVERDFLNSGNRQIALEEFGKHEIDRDSLGERLESAESSDWFLRMGQWETARVHLGLMKRLHDPALWKALLAHEVM